MNVGIWVLSTKKRKGTTLQLINKNPWTLRTSRECDEEREDKLGRVSPDILVTDLGTPKSVTGISGLTL